MKKIILIIAIIAFVGCKEEAPSEPKITIKKEYTLEELENDTNWVEITDLDTLLKFPCIWKDIIEFGRIVNDLEEFKDIFKESDELGREYTEYCFDVDSFDIEFRDRTLILYYIDWLDLNVKRKIYKNNILKTYVYIVELYKRTEWTAQSFGDLITLPKLESNYTFVFDSVIVDKE